MDQIILPDEIPLPPEDDVPLPPDDVPLRPEEIPLPPEDDLQLNEHIENQQQKRPQSPPQEPRSSKKSKLEQSKRDIQKTKRKSHRKVAQDEEEEPMTEEQVMMDRIMGFSSFNSTKGKMVPDNQSVGAVHVIKKQRCRQYMNRKGGFNRPLDKTS